MTDRVTESGTTRITEGGVTRITEDTSSASFTISPTAGHVPGTVSITATGTNTNWGANPFSITSGPGSNLRNYVNLSATSATFDITQDSVSGTPIVIADSDSGTTQNFSAAAVVPDAPTIGTATASTDGSGEFTVTFTPPADTGGASIIDYSVVSDAGGLSATVSGSPATVTGGAAGTAYQFKVRARNSAGSGAYSSLTSAVTATGFCASFDGTGGTYFSRAALDVTKAYPFTVRRSQRADKRYAFGTVYCAWDSERSTGNTNGTRGFLFNHHAYAQADDGTAFSSAIGEEAVIPDPYVEVIVEEFVSATERNVYVEGVLEGTNATSRAIDLSTGTPLTRIGVRVAGTQPFKGEIFDVVFLDGTLADLSAPELETLWAHNDDYSSISIAENWFKLDGDGVDAIGTEDMTASGTVSYIARPSSPSQPTRTQAIYEVFKQNTLPSDSPTVVTGQTSPISSITNLADTEFINIAFTGECGAWDTRGYHFIPTAGAQDHLVIVDNGHALQSQWEDYGHNALVRQLVADGYGVLVMQMPGFSPEDPLYTGSSVLHDDQWAEYTSTENPLERFLGPRAIALNNLAARYSKVSLCGLSGGGWSSVHHGAIDPRVNHATICVRGSIADRRYIGDHDFEQRPKPNGWKVEEFYRLCADTNRRLFLIHHPTDTCCFGQTDNGGKGSYLDATGYDTKFLAPIRSEFPNADVQFCVDTGDQEHSFTQEAIDDFIFPALEASLSGQVPRTAHYFRMRMAA